MGITPITQEQWREVATFPEVNRKLKRRPSRSGGKDFPVTQISWEDAIEFCTRLSQQTGYEYRLPSEAEWEYACRAATTTPFHFGATITTNLANYDGLYSYAFEPKGIYLEKPTPVGYFKIANDFGLLDLHGNVGEWCLDCWHDNYKGSPTNGEEWLGLNYEQNKLRVIRGGSWRNEPFLCRSASRMLKNLSQPYDHIGLRIVRALR